MQGKFEEAEMTGEDIIRQFDGKQVRTVWAEDQEEWYFSVVDVVAALTDSNDPKQYIKRMRQRDEDLGSKWGTICTPVAMLAPDGKMRKTNASNVQGVLRIIQSIPSKKAEPFKLWLAQVGRERIEETIDPELTIDRALETYLRKGYSREWINQRLQAIQVRKELTDEWQNRGISQRAEFAILIDEITRTWSGMSTRQYKGLKGLRKENLRDNMTTLELVLNMLAEATTTEFSKQEEPQGFEENKEVAQAGGAVAGDARRSIEARTGKSVTTSKNAADIGSLMAGAVEATSSLPDKTNPTLDEPGA